MKVLRDDLAEDKVSFRRFRREALALGQLQHSNIVCDVEPANVLLHTDGQGFLTDFGVARLAAEGTGGGTPSHMAREQFGEAPTGGRTDIYALGVVLFELLTGGDLPFCGDSPQCVGNTTRSRIA